MKILQRTIFPILGLILLSGCGEEDIVNMDINPHKLDRSVLENIDRNGTLATLLIYNNDTNYKFSFVADPNSNIKAHYQVYIDTDRSGDSGYVLYETNGLGAEYLLEDGVLFKYTGTGDSNWSWKYIKKFEKNGTNKTYDIGLNTFGDINSFNVQAIVLDENWDLRRNSTMEVVTKTIDTKSHLANLENDKGFSIANDKLNFYFTLSSKYKHRGFFINSDANSKTGYARKGYDYLIEDKTVYKYTGENNLYEWSWEEIDKVSTFQSNNDKTTIVPKKLIENWNETIKIYAMGYNQNWQEEVVTKSYAYTGSLKPSPDKLTKEELIRMIRNGENVTEVDVSGITNMNHMFYASSFNQDISGWDVSNVTNMDSMFRFNKTFNQDISGWDVSNVTNMKSMFFIALSFNQDISNWNVSNVTDMSDMFYEAQTFNQDIGSWDVSKVTNMNNMLGYTKTFNQNISNWDVSNVTNYESFSNRSALQENYKPNFGN